jgi:HAD superfamily hydrolase (TIGR01509 family)
MWALIFDLDGTLVDTVYAHVFAWRRALEELGLNVESWKVHRRIGMSGGLLTRAVAREIGRPLSDAESKRAQQRHLEIFNEIEPVRRPLPGARELLRDLRAARIPHAIATSGQRAAIDASLAALELADDIVVVARGDVQRGKPEPDLFVVAAERLGVDAAKCYAVGDSTWDILAGRRAAMLGVGLLSGGYGESELVAAGAFRVYRDAKELCDSLDELGILT